RLILFFLFMGSAQNPTRAQRTRPIQFPHPPFREQQDSISIFLFALRRPPLQL
ncbi:hypothetical protein PIB30_097386, partial [Stylosanthes scabra]|nr:hypothetical protein [Stylosanthes scabra]